MIKLLIALAPVIVMVFQKFFADSVARGKAKKETDENAATASSTVSDNVDNIEDGASTIESAADKW